MSTDSPLADELRTDLRRLDGRLLAGEDFARQLYRALTNRHWTRPGAEEEVSLSWGQAEALVNGLRERHGHRALALAGSGGEGWVSDAAGTVLRDAGWCSRPVLAGMGADRRATTGVRRFGRGPLRTPAVKVMRSRHTLGGVPPHASA